MSKRHDAETGFVYFSRRYYAPTTGRWITPDPLGFADGPNRYAYVHNNPLTLFDLYGLYVENREGVMSFDGSFPEKKAEQKSFKNFWSDASSGLKGWQDKGFSFEGDTYEEQIREARGNLVFDIVEHELEKRQLIHDILSDPANDLSKHELSDLINSNDDFYSEFLKDRALDAALDFAIRWVTKGKNPISGTPKSWLKPKIPGTNERKKLQISAAKGREEHRKFAERVTQKPGWQSEKTIIGPSGEKLRPDAISPSGRPVELKPKTPSGINRGKQQIEKYEEATGKNGRVIYYEPE